MSYKIHNLKMAFFQVSEEPGIGIELNDEIVMRSQSVEIK